MSNQLLFKCIYFLILTMIKLCWIKNNPAMPFIAYRGEVCLHKFSSVITS